MGAIAWCHGSILSARRSAGRSLTAPPIFVPIRHTIRASPRNTQACAHRLSPSAGRKNEPMSGSGRGGNAMRRACCRSAALMLPLLVVLLAAGAAFAQSTGRRSRPLPARKAPSSSITTSSRRAPSASLPPSTPTIPRSRSARCGCRAARSIPASRPNMPAARARRTPAAPAGTSGCMPGRSRAGWRSGSRRKRCSCPRTPGSATRCGASRPCAR